MSTVPHPRPATGLALVPALLRLVRFTHTIFALPFALAAALMAEMTLPGLAVLGWILLAMVGARTLAMVLNRVLDADIDAANPRTAGRELPAGAVRRSQAITLGIASLAALLLAVSRLPEETWVLWPVPVALFVLYPLAKRVTWACHLVLGITIGIAPMGAWIAVTGELPLAPILMGLAVATWIAGFDVVYALLDRDFDTAHGVNSIPARFGVAGALWWTRALHLAAIALLAGAGAAAGSGAWYFLGVALCAGVLGLEAALVRPHDTRRIQIAFAQANGLLAVVYVAFVALDVALM
ncbi:MAG: UbiA-like polyprenyltransferase [Miltoncostaeaceae bacterium]